MRALSLDAYGTLVHLRRPVGVIYAEIAAPWLDETPDPDAIGRRFRAGFREALAREGGQRGDGRAFWRGVVAKALDVDLPDAFEAVYERFASGEEWAVEPGAEALIDELRADGWRVGVLSNADTRLRSVLAAVGLASRLDAIVLSGDTGVDKPDLRAFAAAASALAVAPRDLVHVGDDPNADVQGARAFGATAFGWGIDVTSFEALRSGLQRTGG